jgi:pimeloyl-ACP methyl ester carboxylesterase
MQSHHLSRKLPFGIQTQANWAVRPNGKALVFIHGFGGSAISTWLQFPSLLQAESALSGYDHVFYGYDGLKKRAHASANQLSLLLEKMVGMPNRADLGLFDSISRPISFRYKEVILVAHSLGAVVARIALLDAHRNRRAWTKRTSLVLFAPAHMGANILKLASGAMGVLRLAPVEALARYRFQVLHDLDEQSLTLTQLQTNTGLAIKRGAKHLNAKRVIYGGLDKIVNPHDFCEDPPAQFIQDATHTSVCKPKTGFREPLVQLLAAI